MNRAQLLMVSFLILTSYVTANAAYEQVPIDEAASVAEVTRLIEATVRAEAAKHGKAVRDAHAKHHGCVKAEFKVNDNLSPALRKGVFAQEGHTYPAWIRYSNGSGKSQNDSVGDGRGMAIKLFGVPGKKLMDDEQFTQDFLMINFPVFFVRNMKDYVDFNRAVILKGSPVSFLFPGVNPLNWRLHEGKIARAIQGTVANNPLTLNYWSMTPYALGDRAMKYSVRPCFKTDPTKEAKSSSPNALREAMSAHLQQRGACFEFFVQLQGDSKTMPIEDPTIEWSEKVSRPIKVATITIPAQRFESPEQMRFCENLSLSPWHSVVEQRPLGGINRGRRVVYETVSRVRHELNHELKLEPTGNETFK